MIPASTNLIRVTGVKRNRLFPGLADASLDAPRDLKASRGESQSEFHVKATAETDDSEGPGVFLDSSESPRILNPIGLESDLAPVSSDIRDKAERNPAPEQRGHRETLPRFGY